MSRQKTAEASRWLALGRLPKSLSGANVQVEQCSSGALSLEHATVGGNVECDSNTASCGVGDSTIAGNVDIANNSAGVGIGTSIVLRNVHVYDNTGGTGMSGNTIVGNLNCQRNSPAADDGGNPNTVLGSRRGECSSLTF